MRKIINFNTNWKFSKEWNDNIKNEFLKGENITLPHTVNEIPLHYFDESDTWLISGYQNIFNYDKEKLKDKRILINFEGAGGGGRGADVCGGVPLCEGDHAAEDQRPSHLSDGAVRAAGRRHGAAGGYLPL